MRREPAAQAFAIGFESSFAGAVTGRVRQPEIGGKRADQRNLAAAAYAHGRQHGVHRRHCRQHVDLHQRLDFCPWLQRAVGTGMGIHSGVDDDQIQRFALADVGQPCAERVDIAHVQRLRQHPCAFGSTQLFQHG